MYTQPCGVGAHRYSKAVRISKDSLAKFQLASQDFDLVSRGKLQRTGRFENTATRAMSRVPNRDLAPRFRPPRRP